MKAGVGYSDIPDSAAAGRHAAKNAVKMAGRKESCDLALLFCTSRHDQKALREAVASVLGNSVPVYGGGAIGVITNDYYGYAGDQVGIACLWLDGVYYDVIIDDGLLKSEEDTGFRLGQGIAELGATPETSVMLMYDAVYRSKSGVRMMMATWILAGLEKALGYLPDLTGVGMVADFECNATSQYIGQGLGEHCAMALMFGDDIRIDSVIMHGCRPASGYYTVTKADGPMILEINHKPALTFLDELLGSAIKPEQYPFFLLFGINSGERWGEYCEDNYASRLCLGIAPERGGIVMFEPDMAEGTEFQLMFRSLELDYMKPKIESLFERLNGREPAFAMYIDCGGRCAGYGGADMEDALVLQQAIANRAPLFGIYSGVEIASIAGRPRGLDWTGVLCLFSRGQGNGVTSRSKASANRPSVSKPATEKPRLEERTPLEAVLKMCEQNAAKILALDAQSILLRYELELKRRGFRLISELAVSLRQTENYKYVFVRVAQRVNAALNMQKTLVLLSDGNGEFVPEVMQGFTVDEQLRILGRPVEIPPELLISDTVLVTAADPPEQFANLRLNFNLPFFIASPIFIHGEATALLLTGRMVEQPPYLSRLGLSDLETVQAITELIGSVLIRLQMHDIMLKAETDGMTGLWNRTTFQRMVENYLDKGEDSSGAFILIDVDNFKSINDTYGHIAGDKALMICANAMQKTFRESDIIGRMGGDEFAVFCRGSSDGATAEKNAARILEAWKKVIPDGSADYITASIGISLAPQQGASFQKLYSNADKALYEAKNQGRNRYILFS
ncbi:MAG: diguanylate cyclase [Holophagales bacterium]|jgi:diguanylate cyclase (GGDEF)-like protein|nr:diguanylate cyclase [Holophagales bacterium]